MVPEISVATTADRAMAVGSLVAAFANDPVLRHLFPDEATYPQFAAAFFGRLFDKRVHQKTVWIIGRGAAVAMWDAPDRGDSAEGAIQNAPALDKGAPRDAAAPDEEQSPGTPESDRRAAALETELPADALARVNAYNDAVHAALPETPFWYLGVLGTHPQHAGRRWGHALMDIGLRRAAADGVPAILETSNAVNVEVYRRAGWQISKTVTAKPLTIWIMRHASD